MTDGLSFSQRSGLTPLPRQLRSNELSAELRAHLWAIVYDFLLSGKEAASHSWVIAHTPRKVLATWWIAREHRPVDQFPDGFNTHVTRIKKLFYDVPFNNLFDFIEFLLGVPEFPSDHKKLLLDSFEVCRSAWRIVDGLFVPIGTPAEGEAISNALAEVQATGPSGAQAHLKMAVQHLSSGNWADSIRESIHAVESTAKATGQGSTLADVLKAMQREGKYIHPALVKGFLAIYGYTSDEGGVRHAMVDDDGVRVGENEAIFMFGACASFSQYLLRLSRTSTESD